MGDRTGISWTDATWNPVKGCSRVSEGCRHCYAEVQAARILRMAKGKPSVYDGLVRVRSMVSGLLYTDVNAAGSSNESRWTGKVLLDPKHLTDPLRWKAPRRIFVNSMSDLFHEGLTNEQIAAVFGVMAAAPQHTFQVLTKRAKRMREWFAWICDHDVHRAIRRCGDYAERLGAPVYVSRRKDGRSPWNDSRCAWPLPNVWLGVSVENQEAHDERAEELLACPAAVYFFSVEPILGPVDASQSLRRMLRTIDGRLLRNDHQDAPSVAGKWRRHIDWIIAGCESGPRARPCNVDWLRSLRDQCASAGVPFFLKQAEDANARTSIPGTRHIRPLPTTPAAKLRDAIGFGDGSKRKAGGVIELPYLDGVQHAQFPAAS